MNNDINTTIEELKAAGASKNEAEELAYFSKNLSNAINFERSSETKTKFLEKAGNINSTSQRNFLFTYRPLFASVLGAFLLLSFATVVSAQDSLPGQPLYPVKRITENVVSIINPSFNSEILKRRSREIKHLSNPANNVSGNNSKNVQSAIKDYENELNNHKDIDKSAIEESKTNLEEARKNSIEENRQEIEDIIRKTETEQEDVRGESITPVPTTFERKPTEDKNRENSFSH